MLFAINSIVVIFITMDILRMCYKSRDLTLAVTFLYLVGYWIYFGYKMF